MENNTTNIAGRIDLSAIRKKRFMIDDDPNHILELNTSDLMITQRLSEAYPKLESLGAEASTIADSTHDDDEHMIEDITMMGTKLTDIDTKMRNLVDFIFDSNVSELCAPSGSMYDPINGMYRYEHIITILIGLYETNLVAEMNRMQKRMNSHTAKYTR